MRTPLKIQIITPYYSPDGGPSAPLFTMLAESLAQRGHQVSVICAVPHYPSGKVMKAFATWRASRSWENGVEILRLPVISLNRANLFQRLVQFLMFQIGATLAGLFVKPDVLIMNNPFLMTGIPFWLLSILRGVPGVYSVHDLYPDVGVALGIFRGEMVIKAVTALEGFCLKHASRVRILSTSFEKRVIEMGVPPEKISLIYDWVDTELIQPLPRQNPFATRLDLLDKFVVVYAGNLGLSQGLDVVIRAAELLVQETDIHFLVVGDGADKARLQKMVEALGLTNVKFVPFQARELLPQVLASADVSLVSLQPGAGKGSLPSKSFSILASARPMIACVDQDSELAQLVERSVSGISVSAGNPAALAQAIKRLKQEPELCRQYGENGRAYVLKQHSPDAAAEAFETLLNEALQGRGRSSRPAGVSRPAPVQPSPTMPED